MKVNFLKVVSLIVTTFIVMESFSYSVHATQIADQSKIQTNSDASNLNKFRELFYEGNIGISAFADPQTIFVDDSNIIHIPQKYKEPKIETVISPFSDIIPASGGPYFVGSQREFVIEVTTNNNVSISGYLKSQGNHTNVWILDDDDFHTKTGTIHNDTTCPLKLIKPETFQDVANTFDGIYDRMTDPVTGFAPHANQLYNLPYTNMPLAGDIDNDGKVNILLYDIDPKAPKGASYVAGFFSNTDFFTTDGTTYNVPIDMFHMDIGITQGYEKLQGNDNKLSFYGTLAHEFQHMLYYTHMGVFQSPASASYLWLNEALSGLANVFYVQPGTEIISSDRFAYSSRNNYENGDFFNFRGSQKSYGMGYLHSIFMNKKFNKSYGTKLYDYFRNTSIFGNITDPYSEDAFITKYYYFYDTTNTFDLFLGEGFKSMLGSEFQTYTPSEVFNNLYYLFMENYATDGGFIYPKIGELKSTYKFLTGSSNIYNLWYFKLNSQKDITKISNGGTISLKGYGTAINRGASNEMLYELGNNAINTNLKISIPDKPGMKYYVVIPDINSAFGAKVYPMDNGIDNILDTGGKSCYLFVTTIFNNINTNVSFSWQSSNVNDDYLAGTASIDITSPIYGQTLNASLVGGNSTNINYSWIVGDQIVSTTSTYTPVAVDIDKSILIKITANDKLGELYASTSPLERAESTIYNPITPQLLSKTSSSITLKTIMGYEYSVGGDLWQDSPIFLNLVPDTDYTFYQRVKATTTHKSSNRSNFILVRTDAHVNDLTGTLSIDSISPKIGDVLTASLSNDNNTGVLTYTWKSRGTIVATGTTSYTILTTDLGNIITLEVTSSIETGNLSTSTNIVTKKDATIPPAPNLDTKTHNSITLIANINYEFSKDNGVTWQDSNIFSALTPNTSYNFVQRTKETEDTFASASSPEVTITTDDAPVNALTGILSIDNISPKIGDVLTASLSNDNNTGILTYTWKSGGTIVATGTTSYTILTTDLGNIITLEVTSSIETGNLSTSTNIVTKKDATTPPAPTLDTKTHNSITLIANINYEFSKDNGVTWQDSNIFSALTPNTSYNFVQRTKETEDTFTSASSPEVTITTDDAPVNALTGILSIDNISPKIGDVLTASLSNDNNTGILTYTWKSGGKIVATGTTNYTVATTDLGNIITLEVTSSIETGNLSTSTNIVQETNTQTILVSNIIISSLNNETTISINGGQLQMIANVEPSNATNKNINWTVQDVTGVATISDSGYLKAVKNGTVKVIATAKDGSGVFGTFTININGQCVTSLDDDKSRNNSSRSTNNTQANIQNQKTPISQNTTVDNNKTDLRLEPVVLKYDVIKTLIQTNTPAKLDFIGGTAILSPDLLKSIAKVDTDEVKISIIPKTQFALASYASSDPVNKDLTSNIFSISVSVNNNELNEISYPIKVSIPIEPYALSELQNNKLTGVSYVGDGRVVQLGGKLVDKNIVFYTSKLGDFGIAVTNNIREIKLNLNQKQYKVNDKTQQMDVLPFIENNSTMVPLRVIANILGGEVSWNNESKTVTLYTTSRKITLTQDVNSINSIIIKDDRSFVPLRFVAENLDSNVLWDSNTKEITIYK